MAGKSRRELNQAIASINTNYKASRKKETCEWNQNPITHVVVHIAR